MFLTLAYSRSLLFFVGFVLIKKRGISQPIEWNPHIQLSEEHGHGNDFKYDDWMTRISIN